ncbi:MAG: bacterial translation initiation factor 1 (bif-1), translation initiation factor IF-1 [Candidatus Peregrinibacteria bacterium GW2011_GWF2_33_10]|nr:MAG: bacterial translation initiation factor 1 (bif-1), translation initiation factor IF-1 [Candidatus Peregrinibacteria bacterium GW2011_GWF2_33_10]OGJ46144.1 MAG: translation initiation factor IF-1 [Candidatus Peregrinibacteria bacterium RIFOXYA12_FULL_33_12]OGJ46243.1 MAG: translation initiation factor IF-1 [Candidatus Peregrinibacteria bacterium RIFOXYA2_FULL_33_21]OGJ51648.1 MAG: translation initiation factor IF-1 [Candidatus Peregrinibacteria bacterium RIFOXYB2_FULL_33_20]
MAKNDDVIELVGTVVKCLPNTKFLVEVNDDKLFPGGKLVVECYLAGKMRVNYIKIIAGDKVNVEMSVYDTTKGRITYRHSSNKTIVDQNENSD